MEPDGYHSAEESAASRGAGDDYYSDERSVLTSENGESTDSDRSDVGGTTPVSSPAGRCSITPSSEGYCTEAREAVPLTSLHWVRMSSLRIHDNPALYHSMQDPQRQRFRCIFIMDPWFISKGGRIGINRCRFLLECLHDLDMRLRSYRSRLYVVKGQTIAMLEELFKQWNVEELTFQRGVEPYSKKLEGNVFKIAKSCGVKVHSFMSHTLYDPAEVVAANDNKPVLMPHVLRDVIPKLGARREPLGGLSPSHQQIAYSEEETDIAQYCIPTMQELGFEDGSLYTNVWVGGETEALRRLPLYCHIRSQTTENMVDMLFDKSALSPYVRFGCLSVRYFLWKTKWLARTNPKLEVVVKQLTQKLLDREFYFILASQVPNYDSTENNPICLQLPWESDPVMLALWQEGQTGYPWIDAGMRQLRKEGWIHYYVRESVAAFLTSGDLWISWVPGKNTFEELLLDYEPTVSCGLWMKSSSSAFFDGPVPYYCPISFGQKIDPKGQYIRAFCPELRNMPTEYIFSPWLAPLEVQKTANCIIGTDYPCPIVDHSTAGALCCERMHSVLKLLQSCMSSSDCCDLTKTSLIQPKPGPPS